MFCSKLPSKQENLVGWWKTQVYLNTRWNQSGSLKLTAETYSYHRIIHTRFLFRVVKGTLQSTQLQLYCIVLDLVELGFDNNQISAQFKLKELNCSYHTPPRMRQRVNGSTLRVRESVNGQRLGATESMAPKQQRLTLSLGLNQEPLTLSLTLNEESLTLSFYSHENTVFVLLYCTRIRIFLLNHSR